MENNKKNNKDNNRKKNNRNKKIKLTEKKSVKVKRYILWYLATILEWVNIPLHLASVGYEFDIDIYNKLKAWQYVRATYYISACIDIALFGYFVVVYKKKEELKPMALSVFCCLIQMVLLIVKVKW